MEEEVHRIQETMEKGTGRSEIFTYFYLAIKNKMNRTNHVREKIKHNVTHNPNTELGAISRNKTEL